MAPIAATVVVDTIGHQDPAPSTKETL